MEKPHLLVVDDDQRLRELLRRYLQGEGFYVSTVKNVQEARDTLAFFRVDCMVVDIMLPGVPGTDLLKNTQERLPPVLFLSAMGNAVDRIHGLELGAEDYLTKPFEPKELLLRIHTILNRRPLAREIVFHGMAYSWVHRKLFRGEEEIFLSSSEQGILEVLLRFLGQTVSRDTLAETLGYESYHPRTIDVQINRLRQKIEPDPKNPKILTSVHGKGYLLRG